MMCRYWSLKREARRGAPLLKRLHLEPWTANTGGKVQSEEDKVMKLEVCTLLLAQLSGLTQSLFVAIATFEEGFGECSGSDFGDPET